MKQNLTNEQLIQVKKCSPTPPPQFWMELHTFLRWITNHLVRTYEGDLPLSVCTHELDEITFLNDLHPYIVPSFVGVTEYLSLKRRHTF